MSSRSFPSIICSLKHKIHQLQMNNLTVINQSEKKHCRYHMNQHLKFWLHKVTKSKHPSNLWWSKTMAQNHNFCWSGLMQNTKKFFTTLVWYRNFLLHSNWNINSTDHWYVKLRNPLIFRVGWWRQRRYIFYSKNHIQ